MNWEFFGFLKVVGLNAMFITFPHPVGIVIGNAVIGENVVIYQNCTLGAKRVGDGKNGLFPHIGNNVRIFAGSIILGSINICDHVWIGANSVVVKDIDEPGVYAGSPARRIGDIPKEF